MRKEERIAVSKRAAFETALLCFELKVGVLRLICGFHSERSSVPVFHQTYTTLEVGHWLGEDCFKSHENG